MTDSPITPPSGGLGLTGHEPKVDVTYPWTRKPWAAQAEEANKGLQGPGLHRPRRYDGQPLRPAAGGHVDRADACADRRGDLADRPLPVIATTDARLWHPWLRIECSRASRSRPVCGSGAPRRIVRSRLFSPGVPLYRKLNARVRPLLVL